MTTVAASRATRTIVVAISLKTETKVKTKIAMVSRMIIANRAAISSETSAKIKGIYRETAAQKGYEAGPEQFGLLLQCYVANSEEKAVRNAKEFMWMAGEFTGLTHPIWGTPSGYGSPSNRNALIEIAAGRRPLRKPPTLDERMIDKTFVWGTPDQVFEKLKNVQRTTGAGELIVNFRQGGMPAATSERNMQLFAKEVLPRLHELDTPLPASMTGVAAK